MAWWARQRDSHFGADFFRLRRLSSDWKALTSMICRCGWEICPAICWGDLRGLLLCLPLLAKKLNHCWQSVVAVALETCRMFRVARICFWR